MEMEIIVAGLVATVIGSVWYSQALFGKAWMRLAGVNSKDAQAAKDVMVRSLIVQFVASVVLAFILDMFVDLYGARIFSEGALVGFWVWLGFFATTLVGSVLWENKSWRLYMLHSMYYLVMLSVVGGVLTIW